MRMLLPDAREHLSDDDLDTAYAWPDWPAPTPWLRANMVSTIDGAARAPDGLSGGISTEGDRRVFGRLRGLADVVLAGAGTVRAENYQAARPKPDFVERRRAAGLRDVPPMAVLSRSLELDLTAPIYRDVAVRTIVITAGASDPQARRAVAEVCDVIVAGDDEVDLARALGALHERGLHRVHAEGGPTLLGEIAALDLLDELLLTVSPMLAGGGYADGSPVPRILAGSVLDGAPAALRLHHVLEDDGSLFLSYRRP